MRCARRPRAALAASLADRSRQVVAQEREHRRQPRHDAREHGSPERVGEHRAVERELEAYVRPVEPERPHEGQPGRCDCDAKHAAGEREQQRLDQHHAKDALAACAERGAHG